jgi:hypothetical protein
MVAQKIGEPLPEGDLPHVRPAWPILAAMVAVVFVAFTTWFWTAYSDDNSLAELSPLYLIVLLFCLDMFLLARKLAKD